MLRKTALPPVCFLALLLAPVVGLAQQIALIPGERIELEITPEAVIGEADAAAIAEIIEPGDPIKYVIYTPRSQSPEVAPGVLVFVSPTNRAMLPRDWEPLLDSKNLIFVSATKSGNRAPVMQRMLKAMLAPAAVNLSRGLNMERCYVAGFSGGAKTATRVAAASPSQFKGGIYIGGAVFWDEVAPRNVELLKQNYHVFLVGSRDPAVRETDPVIERFIDEGVNKVRLIEVPNVAHQLPPADYLGEAIDYLDSRLANTAVPSFGEPRDR